MATHFRGSKALPMLSGATVSNPRVSAQRKALNPQQPGKGVASSALSFSSAPSPSRECTFAQGPTVSRCGARGLQASRKVDWKPLSSEARESTFGRTRSSDCTTDFLGGSAVCLRRGGKERQARKLRKRGFSGAPSCLMQGVDGSYWEGGGGESESASSGAFYPQQGAFGKADNRSVLLNLIREIKPTDLSHISKDASVNSMDAMKRTISGMLGLLPADQFSVTVAVDREPLGRLLVSAMMTGYTLRNAEFRMCLQRTLDLPDSAEASPPSDPTHLSGDMRGGGARSAGECTDGPLSSAPGCPDLEAHRLDFWAQGGQEPERQDLGGGGEGVHFDGEREGDEGAGAPLELDLPDVMGELSPGALAYIQQLQSNLASTSEELARCKQALAELEVDNIVASEDQNDLLDYLRSLDPEKVAELSQPTSPEAEEAIHEVIAGLLGTLSSPGTGPNPPPGSSWGGSAPTPPAGGGFSSSPFNSSASGRSNGSSNSTSAAGRESVGNSASFGSSSSTMGGSGSGGSPLDPLLDGASLPLHFQSTVTASRDYLARLLFWCMLLGHHMRALESRLELCRTFNLHSDVDL
eukprot:TRINITY_DN29433_c0_g1_i1.p1 TRINITY_DN29433_c0_g1~~TRINITY_DN29433_c0_g1_i1.p1  ORF type:complete len:581 (+),score=113.85 TRINITY_DN29433_c0_g1_i1:625-2367(+)